jgi:hypothetical protein
LWAFHLLRWRGTGDEQSDADKKGTFQSGFLRFARQPRRVILKS